MNPMSRELQAAGIEVAPFQVDPDAVARQTALKCAEIAEAVTCRCFQIYKRDNYHGTHCPRDVALEVGASIRVEFKLPNGPPRLGQQPSVAVNPEP